MLFFLAVHTQTYKNDRLFILSKMHTETTVLQTLLNVLAFYQISFHCIWNLLIIGLKSKECGKHVLYPSADSKAESLLLAFPVCPKSKVEPMPQRWALVCRCLLCLFLCVWVWGHTDMLECKTFLGSGDVVLERRYLVLEGKRWAYQTHVAHCLSLLKAMLGVMLADACITYLRLWSTRQWSGLRM